MTDAEIAKLNKDELISLLEKLENEYKEKTDPLVNEIKPIIKKFEELNTQLSNLKDQYTDTIKNILSKTLELNQEHYLLDDEFALNYVSLTSYVSSFHIAPGIAFCDTDKCEALYLSRTLTDKINKEWNYFETKTDLDLYLNINESYHDFSYLEKYHNVVILVIRTSGTYNDLVYRTCHWDPAMRALDIDCNAFKYIDFDKNVLDYKFFKSIKAMTLYLKEAKIDHSGCYSGDVMGASDWLHNNSKLPDSDREIKHE